MTCTVAAIIATLGYMPPKGTVITIPRSAVQQYSVLERVKIEACAIRYGIRWKIDKDK
jgi:hypothetical protein